MIGRLAGRQESCWAVLGLSLQGKPAPGALVFPLRVRVYYSLQWRACRHRCAASLAALQQGRRGRTSPCCSVAVAACVIAAPVCCVCFGLAAALFLFGSAVLWLGCRLCSWNLPAPATSTAACTWLSAFPGSLVCRHAYPHVCVGQPSQRLLLLLSGVRSCRALMSWLVGGSACCCCACLGPSGCVLSCAAPARQAACCCGCHTSVCG